MNYFSNLFVCTLLLGLACNSKIEKVYEQSIDGIGLLGTQAFIWKDTSRVDSYYGGYRIINAKIWYPVNKVPDEGVQSSYFLFIDKLKGQSEFEEFEKLKTQSITNTVISSSIDKAPLLIFSPSLGGNLSYYTFYAEYFARKGYLVMGVNHLYESDPVLDEAYNVLRSKLTFHDSLKMLKIPDEISADSYREVKGVRQKVLGEDISFALDQILIDPEFGPRIDHEKIGVFGHSIGGAGAIYASMLDNRFKAVIDLDGTPPSLALDQGIDVPFLFIEDLTDYQNHQGYAKMHVRRSNFCEKNRADSWRVLIDGIHHNSFLDINYQLAKSEKEKYNNRKPLMKIFSYMDDFLSYYLLNEQSLLILSEQSSEEMEVIYFNVSSG